MVPKSYSEHLFVEITHYLTICKNYIQHSYQPGVLILRLYLQLMANTLCAVVLLVSMSRQSP